MLDVYYQAEQNVVVMRIEGLLTLKETEMGVANLAASISKMREACGEARLLVLGHEAQSAPVLAKLLEARLLRRPGERAATVVGSVSNKMHGQSNAAGPDEQLFLSENAARTWLSVGMAQAASQPGRMAARA